MDLSDRHNLTLIILLTEPNFQGKYSLAEKLDNR
jgi:hypothetical protein